MVHQEEVEEVFFPCGFLHHLLPAKVVDVIHELAADVWAWRFLTSIKKKWVNEG